MKQLDRTAGVGPQQPNHLHDVRKVQSHLNRHAHATHVTVKENGIFDWETLRAIHAFQRRVLGMSLPDGVVPLFGVMNWHLAESFLSNLLSPFPVPPSTEMKSSQLTVADYARAAANLKCEVAAIQAVADVESGGRSGFDANNRPVILYERAIFSRLTKHVYDKTHPDISGRHAKGEYPSGSEAKYRELERAYRLSRDAALESTSWGAFQILG
jgi:N-acetylmuramidase